MRKIIQKLFFCLFPALLLTQPALASGKQGLPKLLIFHSPGCHRCIEVEKKVMPVIEKEFQGKVAFEYLDVGYPENYKLFLGLQQQSGSTVEFHIPVFYIEGRFLNSQGEVEWALRSLIKEALGKQQPAAGLIPADPLAFFKSFVPLSVIIAGLEDGINPCAFTVIVFFMSFLAVQGYRKRELFFIGSSFILAVFLTYLGIGLGIFNFFYRFKGFWMVSRLFNMVVGAASILFGVLAVSDFIKFKKTGSTEHLILQLPRQIKERIHKVVGFFYRKDSRREGGNHPIGLAKLVTSALVTGFLVSLLEAVCTGQVYLPTIAFVLKASPLKLQALGYLLLYNIMFIIPLLVIFVLALTGTTSAQFSSFLRKHLGLIKIFMAALFFGLGIFLIWRA